MAEDGTGSEPSEEAGAATPEPMRADTEPDGPSASDTDKTEHAPLAQWASRAGGRAQPAAGSAELQAPTDPWPEPIQGLGAPADQAAVDHLETLSYIPPPALPATLAAAPERLSARGLIAILAVTAFVLLVAAAGLVGAVLAETGKRRDTPAASRSSASGAATRVSSPADGTGPTPSTAVTDALEEPIPAGPLAQGVPPASVFDMDEICRGETYWPMLPKRTGKAPHPTLVYGDTGDQGRLPYTMFNTWFLKSKDKETAWSYDKPPTTIQLVACVDRVATGAKVRTCTDPERYEGTGVLHRATYRVHLHETATGKKLFDKKMEAKDTSCPQVARLEPDKKLYMELGEPALVAALGKFVEN
ncbi:hypothetical protein GCM10010112_75500 [Actinoplanes lobatus]|uniref:Uncharacterized protein n=1 Tax=Actinoplanes lobatus TaxID=113568 RepID=A0A7W7HH97_9ACTN|nr:hypothetical protein [Actinoplanes lobatus]MBB4750501.1 hypothetical protein [Actinoplanes lobatus]GGN90267.1 hypothetical protein GCM10010112_75500 [Actinoplanes lobatus]GIE43822.1 hypothetical protein Alo02nite_67200 [Actinoplanes lobatus]